jgi:hypothetical protein
MNWEFLEKSLDRPEALGDPLRVVDPVDPHSQVLRLDSDLLQHPLLRRLFFRRSRFQQTFETDADGKRLYRCRMASPSDREPLPIDFRFKKPVDGLQEVVAMKLNMESYEVRSEHPQEDLLTPRADAVGFGVRPRDVPENGHLRIGTLLLDHQGEERKMIILNEDRVLRSIS